MKSLLLGTRKSSSRSRKTGLTIMKMTVMQWTKKQASTMRMTVPRDRFSIMFGLALKPKDKYPSKAVGMYSKSKPKNSGFRVSKIKKTVCVCFYR